MGGRANANLHLNYPEGLRGTSLQAKVLYTRLLSDDALNHAGVLPLRVALWVDQCEMSEEDVKAALFELEDKRYAYTDWKTHQVLVRTLIRNDGIADMPNVLWSAVRAALHLRSEKLRRVLAGEFRKLAPQAPDKVNEKTGKRYVYPDPHGTADKIDPGPPDGGEEFQRNPSEPFPTLAKDAGTPGGGGGGGGKSHLGSNSSKKNSSSSADANAAAAAPPRADVDQLCTRLRDRVADNGLNPPKVTAEWRRQARLLIDTDRRDLSQALRLIDWCQSDPFWAPNVMSMPKFRKQYDQLLAKARQDHGKHTGGAAPRRTTDDKRAAIPGLVAEVLGNTAARPELRAVPGGWR